MGTAVNKSRRGFASMPLERRREIARKGGKSVPSEQRSFAKNPELASTAGRKGGLAVSAAKRSFSIDRQLASQAGKKGGHASRSTPRADDDIMSGGA
ncbi:MAG: general stress protein [Methylocystis sp.]